MLKTIFIAFLPMLMFFGNGSVDLLKNTNQSKSVNTTGTLEKMIVESGSVAMDLDLNRLNGRRAAKAGSSDLLRFDAERNSFFSIIVYNDELRGPLPSSLPIIPQTGATLPAKLNESYGRLVIEHLPFGEQYELAVRDGKTGFIFFNIEGHLYDFDSDSRALSVGPGRLLISKDFAVALGRPADAGTVIGTVSINATMRSIEVKQLVNGEIRSEVLPAMNDPENAGTVPGPDVVVGDVIGLSQFGSSGGFVGLAVGTDSCNYGTVDLNWFANPSNDHPVIPQNMYRMSGGTDNQERFEQIGQSSVKHAFTALTQNLCGLGCNGVGGSRLGSGCSDPYSASLNAGPNLGSRAWINPFTGAYPRNDSATPNNTHSGHSHNGVSHRILTPVEDLNTTMNSGATYYAEAQYITPHEYAWCQSNPGQCNMYNNVSYRRYNVSGTTSFGFSPVGSTVREKPAVDAWPGATHVRIEPDPGNDGIGLVSYKVTSAGPGVWHYEYTVYNQNIDRSIQSFAVPTGEGVLLSNIGFHAPPQHPAWTNDGTFNSAGFSDAPWAQSQTGGLMTWNSETFAQNQNANAIRWGTMYNFRFDSNRPPQAMNATVGFFKTGAPITVEVLGPSPVAQTAAVTVSGRVTTAAGRGIPQARVTITDPGGNLRTVLTNPFGYYRISGIIPGETYTIGVSSKAYSFTSQEVEVNDNISGINFVPNE
jgi:hypothetical protein